MHTRGAGAGRGGGAVLGENTGHKEKTLSLEEAPPLPVPQFPYPPNAGQPAHDS